MHIAQHQSQFTARSQGFTLVEVLVVMVIIAILVGLGIGVLGTAGTQARIARTQVLIKTIDGMIAERLRRADDDATFTTNFKNFIDILDASGNEVAWNTAVIVKRKLSERREFPVQTSDLQGWDTSRTWDDSAIRKSMFATAVSATDPVAAAEILHRILSPTGTPIDGISPDMQVDSNGNGKLELVDAWAQPLRFVLWPDLTATNAKAKAALMSSVATTADPDDPYNVLDDLRYRVKPMMGPPGMGTAISSGNLHQPGTKAPFLVISCGPDRRLGMYEPGDSGNQGHFGAIRSAPEEDEILDNLTNRQGR